MTEDEVKTCRVCKQRMLRGRESRKNYAARQFCSKPCYGAYSSWVAQKRRQADKNKPPRPEDTGKCVVCGKTYFRNGKWRQRWERQRACGSTCAIELRRGPYDNRLYPIAKTDETR